jgi:phage repressor protein C with HTH and peptisase S24 domain
MDGQIGLSAGEQIRKWVGENYKSAKDFSRATGIPYTTINNWYAGKREPSWTALEQLLKLGFRPAQNSGSKGSATQVPMEYTLEHKPQAQELSDNVDPYNLFKLVPLLDVSASAGVGAPVFSENEEDKFAFNSLWIRQKGLSSAMLSVIHVVGDSMFPLLEDGSLVLIKHETIPIHGKIGVVRIGHNLLIKRLRLSKSGWIATSDNPNYDPIELDDESAIIGLAVATMKDL